MNSFVVHPSKTLCPKKSFTFFQSLCLEHSWSCIRYSTSTSPNFTLCVVCLKNRIITLSSLNFYQGFVMEDPLPLVKASLRLGSESFTVSSDPGILSEQLSSMKEKSMVVLKDYITRHNAPADVPDEPLEEASSEEEEDAKELSKPPKKSKNK